MSLLDQMYPKSDRKKMTRRGLPTETSVQAQRPVFDGESFSSKIPDQQILNDLNERLLNTLIYRLNSDFNGEGGYFGRRSSLTSIPNLPISSEIPESTPSSSEFGEDAAPVKITRRGLPRKTFAQAQLPVSDGMVSSSIPSPQTLADLNSEYSEKIGSNEKSPTRRMSRDLIPIDQYSSTSEINPTISTKTEDVSKPKSLISSIFDGVLSSIGGIAQRARTSTSGIRRMLDSEDYLEPRIPSPANIRAKDYKVVREKGKGRPSGLGKRKIVRR